jgi:hypothetical protein
MYRFVHILTITALSVHVLFGCCLHHAHKLDWATDAKDAAVAASCTCHRHGHNDNQGPSNKEGQDDRSSHHKNCDGGTCVFMRANSVDTTNLSIGQNCQTTLSVVDSSLLDNTVEELVERIDRLVVPIPIHLANQSLLL